MNKLLGNKGYTLIELMTVIAMIVVGIVTVVLTGFLIYLMFLGAKALTIYINSLALLI